MADQDVMSEQLLAADEDDPRPEAPRNDSPPVHDPTRYLHPGSEQDYRERRRSANLSARVELSPWNRRPSTPDSDCSDDDPPELAWIPITMPQYTSRDVGDPSQIKKTKQSMADLKLRRLTELNNRLREDLERERIPVSQAAKR